MPQLAQREILNPRQLCKIMSKFIRVIEGYGPTELKEEGWPYDNICVIYDYYSRGVIESQVIKKIMIHFLMEQRENERPVLNGILSYFEKVDNGVLSIVDTRDKFIYCTPSLENALLAVGNQFDLDNKQITHGLLEIKNRDFLFSGSVGKSTKLGELRWSYDSELRYFWQTLDNQEIPIFSQRVRIIDHKIYFSKIITANDTIEIKRTGTDDKWKINTKSNTIEYISHRAQKNDPHGTYDLGKMYRDGNLIGVDLDKARMLLQKAADLGYSRAIKELENL